MTSMPWTPAVGASRSTARAFLFLALFSLPFGGVGVFMAASGLLALARGERADEDVIARVVAANGHVGNRVFLALEGRRVGRSKDSTLASGLGDRDQAERMLAILRRAVDGEA